MKCLRLIAATLALLLSSITYSAETLETSGTVTNISLERQTITIRDTAGQRRTYFFDDETRFATKGDPISPRRLNRGNTVTFRYTNTDAGREIVSARVPEPEEILDVIEVETAEERFITGTVTGVRAAQRSVTIRDDETRKLRTLLLPEGTQINRKGRPIPISRIRRGNFIEARYRVTERGLIIVTGRSPDAVADASPAMDGMLPKTAGQRFAFLFTAFGLLAAGACLRLVRKRTA